MPSLMQELMLYSLRCDPLWQRSDRTQGPSCSLACAAGTVFRNYFVPFREGGFGQTAQRQINLLSELESTLLSGKLPENPFFTVKNGYVGGTRSKSGALRCNVWLTKDSARALG